MNSTLSKILVVIIGGFLALSAVLYIGANGLKAPAKGTHVAQEEAKQVQWSFDGAFGTVDKAAAQRGYQVYKEVCANCHSMNLFSFRDLSGIGFSDAEIKAIAKDYKYADISDTGDAIERDGKPNDKFKNPYPNKQAAAAANGAVPPDLSLILKAREDGANYIYSLLTGFDQTPRHGLEVPAGKYYNPYFPGGIISMPKPLADGQVTYQDGTKASVDQMARDVVSFLQYTAEPEMSTRKEMGIKVILFLGFFTVFFYIAKVRIWAKIH